MGREVGPRRMIVELHRLVTGESFLFSDTQRKAGIFRVFTRKNPLSLI